MESITIDVIEGKYKKAKEARRDGQIPMVYYAKGIEPRHFTVEYQNFRKAYKKAGKSTIITLLDEKNQSLPVLVQEIQYHPVTDDIFHIDVKAILAGEKIRTDIPLVFVGESPAVRELGGTLIHNKDTVHVECLPKDLPHEIEVSIAGLIDFHSSITIKEVQAPKGVIILDDEELSIITVSAPRKEEEISAAPVPAATTPATGEKKEGAEK